MYLLGGLRVCVCVCGGRLSDKNWKHTQLVVGGHEIIIVTYADLLTDQMSPSSPSPP